MTNKSLFAVLLTIQCLALLTHAVTTSDEEQNKPSFFNSAFTRLLQTADDTYTAFNNSTYQYIFRFYEFCGDWTLTSPSFYQTQEIFDLSQVDSGLAVVNMTSLKTFDIILFESKYIDQQFVVVSFNFSRLFSDIGVQNQYTTVYNENITYYIGRNLFRNNIQESGTCELQEIQVHLYNGKTGQGFIADADSISDLRLEIEVKENKGCLFSFKSSEILTCGQQMPLQPWIYLLLNVVKAFCNLRGTSIQYDTGLINKSLEFQFILSFALNCYIYFLNVELAHFLAPTIFAVVPISLFSIALDYTVLLKSFEKFTVMSVALSCVILCTILLYMEEGVYWIAVPFIAITLIDVIKMINPMNISKFSFSFYFGYLLPAFVLLIYLRLYPNSFARLSPKYGLVTVCALSLIVGICCVQFGGYIQKIRVARRKEKYYVEMKEIPKKDICPICMNRLYAGKKDSINSNLEAPLLENEADDNENPGQEPQVQERIIKTPCQHRFHEKCLSQWLDRKAECPYCRMPIPELA